LLTQAAFGNEIGLEWYQVKDLESGKVEISPLIAKVLYHVFDANPDWVLKGEGEMFKQEGSPIEACAVSDTSAPYGDFVYVPQVTGAISAGGGLVPDNTIEMKIAFRREWIERRGDPRNMSLIRVSGDSMEPTLVSGDLVLVDHGRNVIDPQGGIYAISLDDTIMIKRLQLVLTTSRLKIISDNGRYDSAEIEAEQVGINGRVIWFGRELER